MNKALILVVEDDAPIRNLITTTLKTRDYKYLVAANGESALMEAASHNPDIILLDLGLPDMDGIEIIKQIRSWSNIPIIVISARSEDTDKIEALDQGADDYLTKPFSVEELLARLRVMQRRLAMISAGTLSSSSVFVNGNLKVDYVAGCAYLGEKELHLTPIEYKILCLLAQNVGRVLTHTYITQKILGQQLGQSCGFPACLYGNAKEKAGTGTGFPAIHTDAHWNRIPDDAGVGDRSRQDGKRSMVMTTDEKFMKEAIRQAKKAYALDEVPIGCVIVQEGKIIARGYNRRNTDKNTLSHAELIAIKKASKKLGDWRLEGCTMYVTLEPCQMCAGAIVQARVTEVVIGSMNPKAGCAGSVLNLLEMKEFNHQVIVRKDVLRETCSDMLSSFFRELREKKKQKK